MDKVKLLVVPKLSEKQLAGIREAAPWAEVVMERDPERARQALADAEIMYCYMLPGPLEEARSLKWIQLVSAGVDHVLRAGAREMDVLITTASGIHEVAMAEYALWAMLTHARNMEQIQREVREKKWRPSRPRSYYGTELRGKTLGVLGLGAIGRGVAAVCSCLGMRTVGLRRSGRTGGDGGPVEKVYGPAQLHEMLGECDYLFISVPLTEETRGMLGEAELRAMKPSAFIVNVARGDVMDEDTLVRALKEGWIAGAALDVFTREPLPPESPLWDMPNVIVTPHLSGDTLPYMDRANEIFCENLRRYREGGDLINLLDKGRGY